MIGRVPHRLLLVGIVMAASACDNVSWGGMELGLRSPEGDTVATPPDSIQAEEAGPPAPDLGPLLYAGVREGNRGRVFPVAEITQAGLQPLSTGPSRGELNEWILATRLGPGRPLALFHQGVRIGSMEVETGDVGSDPFCGPRAQATGHLQLTPEGAEVQRFLAMDAERARGISFEPFETLSSVYEQRVASLNLGAEAIPLVGATWPPSLLEIRQDLRVFALPGGEAPAVLATFVFRDQLRVGPAPDNAYALMVMGEPRGSTFDLAFTWYRNVGAQGKGAPRYFSRLDWDRDGDQEILLEVLGEETRWFAAINRGPDGWVLTYEDPCGIPGDGGA